MQWNGRNGRKGKPSTLDLTIAFHAFKIQSQQKLGKHAPKSYKNYKNPVRFRGGGGGGGGGKEGGENKPLFN